MTSARDSRRFYSRTDRPQTRSSLKTVCCGVGTELRVRRLAGRIEVPLRHAPPGKDIAISSSATLVRSLLRDGLLDELGLLLFPVVVGMGKRLFDDWAADQAPLELVESREFKTGVLSLTYQPAGT